MFILLLALMPGCRQSAEYPNRPIALICPWAAGGGTDRISRQIAVQLEQELGIPVNVINATGGAGVTGHARGAFARPDGYTITMITPELNMLHWRGLTEITYKNFDPLMMVNRDGAAIFVRANSPWQTLADLAKDIKANPGQVKASGTAFGGIWHLSLAGWLNKEKDIKPNDVPWVASQGSNPSLQELRAGGVDIVCCSIPEAETLLAAKEIRCLGLMAPEQLDGKEEIPTFQQQGVDWSHIGWRGLAVPKGVAPERKQRLIETLQRVVASDEYLQFLKKNKFGAAAVAGDDFATFLAEDDERYRQWLTGPEYRTLRRQPIGAMAFPALLAGLLLFTVVSIALIRPAAEGETPAVITRSGVFHMTLIIGWILAFLLLMPWTGFVLAGIVLLGLLLWMMKAHWLVTLLLPPLLVVTVYLLFAVCLRVMLP